MRGKRVSTDLARRLRHEQTDAERQLWKQIRDRQLLGTKFRRQQLIGKFIVDFFCPEFKLILELDGGHHTAQKEADQDRIVFLSSRGYRVLRFWNNEVLQDMEGVLERIAQAIQEVSSSTPHPHPLPQGERVE